MKAFEYAAPRSESEVLELLSGEAGHTEVLAGGTDLVGLMKKMIVTPDRVVSLSRVASLKKIEADSTAVRVGAMVSLDELAENPVSEFYPAIRQAIDEIASLQLRSQGTLGGELCQRPRCWYFRDGHGLLAARGKDVVEGDSRFHAIFGNAGPAKFVCPSRLAPALVALDARLRILGPHSNDETLMPLEAFYRTPKSEREREFLLDPNQFVAQVILPHPEGRLSASYEVRHGAGPEYPLVSAASSILVERGRVVEARVVLGQVAPTPWISREAIDAIVGRPVTPETAEAAGEAAASVATPLRDNEYKVRLAKVAVKRSLLKAAGLETGGF
ncbi:MAG: molybdopterin dehydrogenase [Planctomycetota bacterium]|nr:MAG: molybdopterin dehydrogenase [Planctomycetota bacterium]